MFAKPNHYRQRTRFSPDRFLTSTEDNPSITSRLPYQGLHARVLAAFTTDPHPALWQALEVVEYLQAYAVDQPAGQDSRPGKVLDISYLTSLSVEWHQTTHLPAIVREVEKLVRGSFEFSGGYRVLWLPDP